MTQFPIKIKKYNSMRDLLINFAIVVITFVFILLLIFNALYTRIYVVGSSMQHTFKGAQSINRAGGDYVYICEFIEPKYGDIVVIDVGNKNIIKRVIALGGDTVRLDHGVLYLKKSGEEDEKLIEEPYVSSENNTTDMKINTFDAITVEEGYVFCMGDNRDHSQDSRDIGCMKLDDIVGVVTGWSIQGKDIITGWNTFFDFTLPELFGQKNNL